MTHLKEYRDICRKLGLTIFSIDYARKTVTFFGEYGFETENIKDLKALVEDSQLN